MNQEIYALWLARMPNLGLKSKNMLYHEFKSFETIFFTEYNDLIEVVKQSSRIKTLLTYEEFVVHQHKIDYFTKEYNDLKQQNVKVISLSHPNFPRLLREVHDCPILIYAKGKIDFPEFSIGIVGARRCSQYGKKVAIHMAGELAKSGVNVVSGLAYGIDVAAHQGVLNTGGFTTAVLAGGLNCCYPPQHQKIFEQIQENGTVISEEHCDVLTEPYMFPKRNRIISGMSQGILVVEAAQKSGSLITVDFALEQGRDVFAIPNRLFEFSGEGSNNLLKQGAKLVCHVDDILSEIAGSLKAISEKKPNCEKKLDEKEKIVYSCISYDPCHEDLIIESVFERLNQYKNGIKNSEMAICDMNIRTFEVSDIQLCLLKLEMSGLIRKISSCYYARSEV